MPDTQRRGRISTSEASQQFGRRPLAPRPGLVGVVFDSAASRAGLSLDRSTRPTGRHDLISDTASPEPF
jgi:hypothetical protein